LSTPQGFYSCEHIQLVKIQEIKGKGLVIEISELTPKLDCTPNTSQSINNSLKTRSIEEK